MFFIIMPDGLAIKSFTLSPLPPNSVLIVYRFEFECMTQKPFQIFSKNKTDYLHSDKLSNCISCSLASTCLSKYYVKKRGRQKKKEKNLSQKKLFLNYKQDTLKPRTEEKGNLFDLSRSFCFEIWGRQNQLM